MTPGDRCCCDFHDFSFEQIRSRHRSSTFHISQSLLPDGSGHGPERFGQPCQSRLHHQISLSLPTQPLWHFAVPVLCRSTWLQVHHIRSRSTMFRNQIPQICLIVYSPADGRTQIKPSSPASGTCMPSAALWTDPSPSGSARTPGCQWARLGRATAGARARPAAGARPGGRGRRWRRVLLVYRAACGCFPCRQNPRSWGTYGAGAGRRRPRRRRWRGPARRRPR